MKLTAAQHEGLQVAADDILAIRHLRHFVRQAWKVLEPGNPLKWNWHIDVICAELEAVSAGGYYVIDVPWFDDPDREPLQRKCEWDDPGAYWVELKELVICIPPRMLKSRIVSVCWQSWWWLQNPSVRVISLSNDKDLASRDSREMRELIKSPWYRRLIATATEIEGKKPEDAWTLDPSQAEKKNFLNSVKGYRIALSVGGSILGKGADGLIIDDPYDIKKVTRGGVDNIAMHMAHVVTDYATAWRSRLNDPAKGWRVTIMQRLHEDDLAGVLIKKGVRCVVLPQEFDPDFPKKYGGIYEGDPRTKPGELLMGNRYTQEVVDDLKSDPAGARLYAAMHKQRPTPDQGNKFKRDWFNKVYDADPQRLALGLDEIMIMSDCAAKKGETNSRSAIVVLGREGLNKFYVLDVLADRMTITELQPAFERKMKMWAQARKKLIEDASNGIALIQILQANGEHGIIAVSPHGASKEERANYSEVAFQAGQVWLPKPEFVPQIGELVEEHIGFTGQKGEINDIVDALAMGLAEWTQGDLSPLERLKRMQNAVEGAAG